MKDETRRCPDSIRTVLVAGLGLIGGSMAKAVKKNTGCRVLGWNRTRAVAEQALADGAIDAIAGEADLAACDLLIPAMPPAATEAWLLRSSTISRIFVTGVLISSAFAKSISFMGFLPRFNLSRSTVR